MNAIVWDRSVKKFSKQTGSVISTVVFIIQNDIPERFLFFFSSSNFLYHFLFSASLAQSLSSHLVTLAVNHISFPCPSFSQEKHISFSQENFVQQGSGAMQDFLQRAVHLQLFKEVHNGEPGRFPVSASSKSWGRQKMDCYHVRPTKQKPSQANTQANTENIQPHTDS